MCWVWRFDVILVVETKTKAYWSVIEINWIENNELENGILNYVFQPANNRTKADLKFIDLIYS